MGKSSENSPSLVTIATTVSVLEARIVVATLETEGIRAFIPNEHTSTTLSHLGLAIHPNGVQVLVSSEDAQAAGEALDAARSAPPLDGTLEDMEAEDEPQDALFNPNGASDRAARDEAAALIRQYLDDKIPGGQFEEDWPESPTDRALDGIGREILPEVRGGVFSKEYTDEYRGMLRLVFERTELFLGTDLPYAWGALGPCQRRSESVVNRSV